MLAEENKNSGTSALEGKTSKALPKHLPALLLPACSWRWKPSSCDERMEIRGCPSGVCEVWGGGLPT